MFDQVKFTEDGLGQQQRHRHLLLLNVGVLRGVCGVSFEGGRFLLNNGFRGSNLVGKGAEGMAVYGAGGSGMSGAGRASVSTRFWRRAPAT